MNRTPTDEAALDRLLEHDPAYVFGRISAAPLFCILNTHCGTGDFFINGPFATRTLAQAYAADCAEDALRTLKEEDLDIYAEYELDAEDGGNVVTILIQGEPEMEWSVYELIAPVQAGGPQ